MRLSTIISMIALPTFQFAVQAAWQPNELRLREIGTPYTTDFSIYFETKDTHQVISPFHDISLFTGVPEVFNMVVEIPRWTNAKFEITKEVPLNPIKQDLKDGKVRFVSNLFPFKGYPGNYGALPQTWEDPNYKPKDTGAIGDNDPIDVYEIGNRESYSGEIKPVKVLGVFGLLDDGETDWKLLTIDVRDPLADKMNDVEDIETLMPGYLDSLANFLLKYKEYALGLIEDTHEHWKALMNGSVPADDIYKENLSVDFSPFRIAEDDPMITSIKAVSSTALASANRL
ncbi:inorganic pyrophosphatase [Hesseltinella vesiculosa]|uniref:inorganic diphosphatase n=1 Tax=Hesseltinella vesiculosa TaxID=101127 RepID=A0A1X2G9D4_9FUNG|nr:inorganic pyrophosphatase [Hesseltinella vesiculosa]